jgi:AcrR family transcriptional regulator
MNEYDDAIEWLAEQLSRAGVPATAARSTLRAYGAALETPAATLWVRFYLSVYARLHELSERPLAFVGSPAEPLLTLLRDDLGAQILDRARLERIAARLVEYVGSEASLSS